MRFPAGDKKVFSSPSHFEGRGNDLLQWIPPTRYRKDAASSLTEALGEVCLLVDEDLGGDDLPEGGEGLEEVGVGELLREVVDEEVGPLRSLVLLQAGGLVAGGGRLLQRLRLLRLVGVGRRGDDGRRRRSRHHAGGGGAGAADAASSGSGGREEGWNACGKKYIYISGQVDFKVRCFIISFWIVIYSTFILSLDTKYQ